MNAIYTIIIIAVLVLGGWFLFGDSLSQNGDEIAEETTGEVMEEGEKTEDGTSTEVPAEGHEGAPEMMVNENEVSGEVMESNEVSFDLKGIPFEFDMTEIRVKKGDTVTINFESSEGLHDWVVDEFDAATQQVRPGSPTSVTFVADKSGEFEYYCSVGDHRAQGMVGKLIVE